MYKKITHTIVEEHFGNPVGVEIKQMIDCITTSTYTAPKVMTINSNLAIKFRLDAKTYFSKLFVAIQKLATGLFQTSTPEAIALIQTQLDNTIEELGVIASPFYGIDAGITLSNALKTYILAGSNYARELKAEKDIKDFDAAWVKSIDDIGTFLSSANPMYWPKETVIKIFTDYKTAFIDQISATIKNNLIDTSNAVSLQHDILLGNATGITGLADVFSSGIVRAFPDKFNY